MAGTVKTRRARPVAVQVEGGAAARGLSPLYAPNGPSRRKELESICRGLADDRLLFMEDDRSLVYVPTIFTSYNRAVRLGGHPSGCITVIHGPWAGGKTALAVGVLESFQRQGHLTAFVDAEHAADTLKWFRALGVDLGQTLLYRPRTYEQTVETLGKLIENFHARKRVKENPIPAERLLCIVVDSINKLVPKEELKKFGQVGRGFPLRALLNSNWMDALVPVVGEGDVAFLFIAQERVEVDAGAFDRKWRVKGGQAVMFDSTVMVRVDFAGKVKEAPRAAAAEGLPDEDGEDAGDDGKVEVGKRHRFVIEKNKVGICHERGYFYTSNGRGEAPLGFDHAREVLDEALARNVLKKPKDVYVHELLPAGIKGKEGLRQALREAGPDGRPRYEALAALLNGSLQ